MNTTNEIIDPTTDDIKTLIFKFKQNVKKSAEAVLDNACLIKQAKENFNKTNFEFFCREVRHKSSSLRKYMRIASKDKIFRKHLDSMPNTWCTLYLLTQLTDEKLEVCIKDKSIHANMTGEDALILISKHVKSKRKKKLKSNQAEVLDRTITLKFFDELTLDKAKKIKEHLDALSNLNVQCDSAYIDTYISNAESE